MGGSGGMISLCISEGEKNATPERIRFFTGTGAVIVNMERLSQKTVAQKRDTSVVLHGRS